MPKSIEEIRQSIQTVPWSKLAHAYHAAWDVPKNLETFLDSGVSQGELDSAIDWMWGSILHQGSLYSASTPVLWILIDLVAAQPHHSAAASIFYAIQTVTEYLLYGFEEENASEELPSPVQQNLPGEPTYEVWVDQPLSASLKSDLEKSQYFRACTVTNRQLYSLLQHAIPVVTHTLKSSDSSVQSASVAAALGIVQVMPDATQQFLNLVEIIGDSDYDSGDWMSVAIVLGEKSDEIARLLTHSDKRMRLSAAMSSSTKGNAQSIVELAAALSTPEWVETAFPKGAAHLDTHLRFHILDALLERVSPESVESFVVDAICTLIRERVSAYSVDSDWGKVLYWAFPDRLSSLSGRREAGWKSAPLPTALNGVQSAVLRALCAKDDLWSRRNGNAKLAYARVQLPYNRQTICSLLERTEAEE